MASIERPGIDALICVALVLSTFVLYSPSLGFDFVDFDDLTYIVHNEMIRDGFSFAGAARLFTQSFEVNWIPITQLSHMLDVEFFGLEPAGHHATSVVIHCLNSALLFLCLQKMTGARGSSAFVAVAFALHPLRVESVAWVSERKDVLSSLFAFLCILSHTAYAKRRNTFYYLLSIALLALGLMSKPMLVTLPFLLLLLDGWPLRRFSFMRSDDPAALRFSSLPARRLLLEKLPMFAIVVAAILWTLVLQASAQPDFVSLPLSARLANALLSYVLYPIVTIWPQDLGILYSHPYRPGTGGIPPSLLQLGGATVAIAAACTIALSTLRQRPYRALGLFWYLGTLLPVIGIIQVGAQGHADRYTYLPMIGLFVWLAWEVRDRWHARGLMAPVVRRVAIASLACWLIVMAMLTRAQLETWRSNRALFEQAVRVSPGHAYLELVLGQQLEKDSEFDTAEAHYRKSLAADPKWTEPRVKLANLLQRQARGSEAIEEIEKAIALSPARTELQMNLANFYSESGRWDVAESTLRSAIALTPTSPQLQSNLANVLLMKGDLDEAARAFEKTVELDPSLVSAWYNWAMVLGRQGNYPAAREKLRRVLELDPAHRGAQDKLERLR